MSNSPSDIDLTTDSVNEEHAYQDCDPATLKTPLEVLYRNQFSPLVRRLSRIFGSGPPAPEDIAQQSFERLVKSGGLAGIDQPAAFLWRVARNLALTMHSSERSRLNREEAVAELDEQGYRITPERVFQGQRAVQLVTEVVRAMPDRRRQAFALVRLEGLTHDEAAEQMKISRPAVSKHVAAAVAQIAKALLHDG